MKISPLSYNRLSFQSSHKKNSRKLEKQSHINPKNINQKIKKVLPFFMGAVGGFYLGYLAFKKKSANIKRVSEKINETVKNNDEKLWLAILALAGVGGYKTQQISKEDKDNIIETLKNAQSPIQQASYGAQDSINYIKSSALNLTNEKYTRDFYGLKLLYQNNALNRNSQKYNKAISDIQDYIWIPNMNVQDKEYNIDRIRIINENIFYTMKYNKDYSFLFDGGLIKYCVLIFFSIINHYKTDTYFFSILYTGKIFKDKVLKIKVPKKYNNLEIMVHPNIVGIDKENEVFDKNIVSNNRIKEMQMLMNKDLLEKINENNK